MPNFIQQFSEAFIQNLSSDLGQEKASPVSANQDVCFGVKDNFDVAGTVSSVGSMAFANAACATQNADVVSALLAAGFRLTGKLNMHELAYGLTGVNSVFGTPVNPLFPDRIPGGSSSGSAAAVAAGELDFSLGTDTGGSVRLPAACCGIFGFKPTFGRLSRVGIQPLDSELDCVGVFARNVEMIERCMQAMDSSFVGGLDSGPKTLRLGVLSVESDSRVGEIYAQAIEQISALADVELEIVELTGIGPAYEAGLTLISREAVTAFGDLPESQLGADVAQRIKNAHGLTSEQCAQADSAREQFVAEVSKVLGQLDALLTPTLPELPLSRNEALAGAVDLTSTYYVRPFNVSGNPAITLPIGGNAAPVGLQVIGKHQEDSKVCAIAKLLATAINLPTYY